MVSEAIPERVVRLAAPFTGREESEAMARPFTTGWLTQGPEVRAFEAEFSNLHGGRHAVATSSGTTALHLALLALGIGPGDEVVVPSFTWVACANAVAYTGAKPVFADVDRGTYNVTAESVTAALSGKTRAVMAVHQFGQCCDVDAIREVLPEGVSLLEDAAAAVGARLRGRLAGTMASVSAFSFHPRKIVTTGEGGMVLTSDLELATQVRNLRNHGVEAAGRNRRGRLNTVRRLGFNYRLTDMQAAMGRVQLGRLEAFIAERRDWADWYLHELASINWLGLPAVLPDCDPVWQSFVVLVRPEAPVDRDELASRLAAQGIETRPGTHSISDLELYFSESGRTCPESRFLERHSLALPLHNRMGPDDYTYVVEGIINAVA